MRKQYPVFVDGCFKMLVPDHPEVFAYTRTNSDTELLVICNFFDKEITCPIEKDWDKYQLLLTNEAETTNPNILKPYEARIYIFGDKKLRLMLILI